LIASQPGADTTKTMQFLMHRWHEKMQCKKNYHVLHFWTLKENAIWICSEGAHLSLTMRQVPLWRAPCWWTWSNQSKPEMAVTWW
jgi:hypothetical protein